MGELIAGFCERHPREGAQLFSAEGEVIMQTDSDGHFRVKEA